MKRRIIIAPLILFLVLSLIACNNGKVEGNQQIENDKLTIFTTIYPIQFFTESIGGEHVVTESVVPPGSDAHSIEIKTKTMIKVAESDAFIHTGTGLESFVESVAGAVKKEDVLIVSATENVKLLNINSIEKNEEKEDSEENNKEFDVDPHFWLDPQRSATVAENIKNALVQLSPENKDEFESNFSTLKGELEELDSEFKNMVDQSKGKAFLVSHSAYGYWEDAYGLKQIGISGLSPNNEPSQKHLKEIIDLAKENNLQYIFFEQNITNKVATVVKKETDTEALTLYNLESLTEDNIKNNENYFDVMRKNIDALKHAIN